MKRLSPILLILSLLILNGCIRSAPEPTAIPQQTATPEPVTAIPPPAIITLPPGGPPSPEVEATPTAPPTPTATPIPPAHPTVTETLAAGLAYVRSGFKLKMPRMEAFSPVEPPADLDGVDVEQALAADGWVAVISPVEASAWGQSYRTIILSKDAGEKVMRWWGQVDAQGIASSVVFTGMPRPKSTRVKGITGKIVQLPDGNPYPRYFEDAKGRRFGIATNKEAIRPLLEHLTEADGRVQLWGELRYAVNDVQGRRILVRKYNLLDVTPEEVLARATPQPSDSSEGDELTDEETAPAVAFIRQPKPHEVIHTQVQVAGDVMGLAGDQVIVRVEHKDGRLLGEAAAPLTPDAAGNASFTAVVPFTNPHALSQGRIAVYAPAGGDEALLGWVEVRFAGDVRDQRVTILQPEAGAGVRGRVKVAGRAEHITTDKLLVRVEDSAGAVLGKARAAIDANGNWRVRVPVRHPKTARPGVIAVYVVDPDDGSLTLLAQIPVKLKR